MKFTFKKYIRTGRYRSFQSNYTDVKLKGIVVGSINEKSNLDKSEGLPYGIGFKIYKPEPDNNPNCEWKWVWLKKRFNTEQEARQFIITNNDQIQKQFNLYLK